MSTDLTRLELAPQFRANRITADLVAESLREAIQTGALPDGAVLNQAALAERFGVSRQPVREAMRQLMAEGLVESRAHHGSVVRGLPVERIGEIYDNIALLEGHMLRKSVTAMSPDDVRGLREQHAAMSQTADLDAWIDRNRRFHETLLRFSGDETGIELVGMLRNRVERYVRMWSHISHAQAPDQAGDEHDVILTAIESRDVALARTELEDHIRRTGKRLVALGTRLASST